MKIQRYPDDGRYRGLAGHWNGSYPTTLDSRGAKLLSTFSRLSLTSDWVKAKLKVVR